MLIRPIHPGHFIFKAVESRKMRRIEQTMVSPGKKVQEELERRKLLGEPCAVFETRARVLAVQRTHHQFTQKCSIGDNENLYSTTRQMRLHEQLLNENSDAVQMQVTHLRHRGCPLQSRVLTTIYTRRVSHSRVKRSHTFVKIGQHGMHTLKKCRTRQQKSPSHLGLDCVVTATRPILHMDECALNARTQYKQPWCTFRFDRSSRKKKTANECMRLMHACSIVCPIETQTEKFRHHQDLKLFELNILISRFSAKCTEDVKMTHIDRCQKAI